MKKIKNITVVYVDDKVIFRLHTGDSDTIDAEITSRALANHIADCAKVLCTVVQRA